MEKEDEDKIIKEFEELVINKKIYSFEDAHRTLIRLTEKKLSEVQEG